MVAYPSTAWATYHGCRVAAAMAKMPRMTIVGLVSRASMAGCYQGARRRWRSRRRHAVTCVSGPERAMAALRGESRAAIDRGVVQTVSSRWKNSR
jgi:hypothetical protein